MSISFRAGVVALLALALARPISATAADTTVEPAQWRALAIQGALASAGAIDDPYRAGETFATIARTQIAIGDEAGAEASLRIAVVRTAQIAQPEFRGWVQYEIVRAQLALNDAVGARETAAAIAADRPQGAAYVLLARRALQSGNILSAQSYAFAIRESEAAGEILSEIVATKALQRDVAGARALQRRIRHRGYAATALTYIAIADARDGKWTAARDTIGRVPRAERDEAIGQFITWLVERGEASAALDLADDVADPIRRAVIIGRLALDAHRNGHVDRARELFAAALSLTGDSKTAAHFNARLQIARLLTLAGMLPEARESVLRITSGLSDLQGKDRDAVLEGAARGYLRLGDTAEALRTGLDIEDRIGRALLIRDVAAVLAADETGVNASLPASLTLEPLANAALQFGALGVRLGKSIDARKLIEAARAQVARIDDPLLHPAALAALAAASVRIGDTQLGSEIFSELQVAAERIERAEQRALAYVRAASALNDRLLFLGKPATQQD